MAPRSNEKKATRSKPQKGNPKSIWVWIAIGAVGVLAIGLVIWRSLDRQSFNLVEGDKQILVLIRNDAQGNYRIQYEGRGAVDLGSVQVMLAGQILHVDVQQVVIISNGQEFVLEPDGKLPGGASISLAPGETFDVRVTYRGQTLGGNYLYGFRLGYNDGKRERSYDLVLEYEYEIIVQ